MPVIIHPAKHAAREVNLRKPAVSAVQLLKRSCEKEDYRDQKIFQSSFSDLSDESTTMASHNGFVFAAVDAYNQHHHLRIRPEDVWFAILTQLGFFINKNSEELRSFFVAHEGKKKLEVTAAGSIDTVDFGELAIEMTHLIEENILDPDLRRFVMPNFTTTTHSDMVVASILMMGAVQKYFDYLIGLDCGLPSVTLLGERADWENMLKRLDYLPRLGAEPTQFCQLLKPVLMHFVRSFDTPADPSIEEFWQKITHHESGGSGPSYLSGWITAFCFWSSEGERISEKGSISGINTSEYRQVDPNDRRSRWEKVPIENCVIGDVEFHKVDFDDVPLGYASVPVKVNDNGTLYDTQMVAGSVGVCMSSSGETLDGKDKAGMDTLQPASGWWMYEKVEYEFTREELREARMREQLESLRARHPVPPTKTTST